MEAKSFGATEVVCFGECEVHLGTREIFVRGHPKSAEPRVFDVFAYLLLHEGRIVSKEELLREVWKTEFVSDTVVARSIMKLRRVIEDNDPDTPIIKTVQRTGYRMVSRIKRHCAPSPAPIQAELAPVEPKALVPKSSRESGRQRVAVLPVSSMAPHDDLSWVEFGLASLMIRAFQLDGGFTTVPLLDVARSLQPAYAALPSAESARLLRESLQIDAVVATHVSVEEGRSQPRIGYTVYTDKEESFVGTCEGENLSSLAISAVNRIAVDLRRLRGIVIARPFDGDPFMSEAFSRGIQAAEQDHRQTALNYLQICVGVEPHPLSVDVEYVMQLAAITDPATPRRATEVLERAALMGDMRTSIKVLGALSSYYAKAIIHSRAPTWMQAHG